MAPSLSFVGSPLVFGQSRRSSVGGCCKRHTLRCGLQGGESVTSFDQLIRQVFTRGKRKTIVTTPVESFPTTDGAWHTILTTNILVKKGKHERMAQMLAQLSEVAEKHEDVLTRAVNQDPEELEFFIVLERFASGSGMASYQKTKEYQEFVRECQPLLEKPMGMYLCRERDGQISSGSYPFGPGGEGGRDDMVFR